MRWLMRNPVVHFLLLGGVLYWLIAAPANDLIQLHHLQLESGSPSNAGDTRRRRIDDVAAPAGRSPCSRR